MRDLVTSLVLRPSRSSLSVFIKQCLLMLALWSCGRRGSVVQAQRQIHRVLLPACPPNRIHGSSPLSTAASRPAEPHIRSPASERLHHNPSFLRSSGSGERVHTVLRHITATVCDGPPARIQAADQASWNSR